MAGTNGTYHLADNPTLYEPQRSNNFEFVVTGLDNLLREGEAEAATEDAAFIKNAQEVIKFSVNKMSVPHFSQKSIEIQRGNNTIKAAGVPTFEDSNLEVNDYIGADGKSVLMAWQRLSYDVVTEKVGRMSAYKKDCTLIERAPDYEIVRYWDLKGCWVSALKENDFDMSANEKRTITATITFDKAIMHLPDEIATL